MLMSCYRGLLLLPHLYPPPTVWKGESGSWPIAVRCWIYEVEFELSQPAQTLRLCGSRDRVDSERDNRAFMTVPVPEDAKVVKVKLDVVHGRVSVVGGEEVQFVDDRSAVCSLDDLRGRDGIWRMELLVADDSARIESVKIRGLHEEAS